MNGSVGNAQDMRLLLCITFVRSAPPAQVDALKKELSGWPSTIQSADISGSYDFFLEGAFPSLEAYTQALTSVSSQFANLVADYNTGFVSRRVAGLGQSTDCFWVPSSSGITRLDFIDIDTVHAEGDYMRVRRGQDSWLLHHTLASARQKLGASKFVQLHRSLIVRCSFIRSLSRTQRSWVANLNDGSNEPVSRSRATSVLRLLKHQSSKLPPRSSRKVLLGAAVS